jgi:hypothetical protein
MVVEQVLALLIAERDRLNRAIEVLQPTRRRGRPPKSHEIAIAGIPKRKRKAMSANQRKAHSERMRRYWAARKAGSTHRPTGN